LGDPKRRTTLFRWSVAAIEARRTHMGMPESSITFDEVLVRGRRIEMNPLNNPVLLVVFAAIFFYVLYGVIVAAVRDGILKADEQREKALTELEDGEKR
jgi:hypothetical protein